VVERGKLITAAGVSAGIDMALHLPARIAGETTARAIELAMEYDPQPPFDGGPPPRPDPSRRARPRPRSSAPCLTDEPDTSAHVGSPRLRRGLGAVHADSEQAEEPGPFLT